MYTFQSVSVCDVIRTDKSKFSETAIKLAALSNIGGPICIMPMALKKCELCGHCLDIC